jgi:hypothetical protein
MRACVWLRRPIRFFPFPRTGLTATPTSASYDPAAQTPSSFFRSRNRQAKVTTRLATLSESEPGAARGDARAKTSPRHTAHSQGQLLGECPESDKTNIQEWVGSALNSHHNRLTSSNHADPNHGPRPAAQPEEPP